MQDLAALVDDLPLLARVAVVEEDIHLGQGVEGDLVGVDRRADRAPGDVGLHLGLQLGDGLVARAADRLVGVHHDAFESRGVAERGEHGHQLHRRAVGVGDEALMGARVGGVDLGHHQRHARLHPPARRVVDDHGAGFHGGRGKRARHAPRRPRRGRYRRRRRTPVRASSTVTRRPAMVSDVPAERADASGTQRAEGERALDEDLQHRPAHGARGADDGDGQRSGGLGWHDRRR